MHKHIYVSLSTDYTLENKCQGQRVQATRRRGTEDNQSNNTALLKQLLATRREGSQNTTAVSITAYNLFAVNVTQSFQLIKTTIHDDNNNHVVSYWKRET